MQPRPRPILTPTTERSVARVIPTLRRLCLMSVVKLIEAATQGGSRMDIHVARERLQALGNLEGVHQTLRQLSSGIYTLPDCIGREIINELCSNYSFNALSAGLLKK